MALMPRTLPISIVCVLFGISTAAEPLSISQLPPTLLEAGGSKTRNFNVAGPPDSEISVSAASLNQAIIRDSDIVIKPQVGPPGLRTIIFTGQAGVQGDTTIILTATTGNLQSTSSFPVGFAFIHNFPRANRTPIQIADATNSVPYPSIISLSNYCGRLTSLSISLDRLYHTYPVDIDILLESPSGDKILLLSDVGGDLDITNVYLTFRMDAQNVHGTNRIISGTYRPTDNGTELDSFPAPAPPPPYSTDLASLLGKSPNGEWKLFVVDDTLGDAGSLEWWSLTVETEILTMFGKITSDHALTFTATGNVGSRVAFESSTNLVAWTELHSAYLDLDGRARFQISPRNAPDPQQPKVHEFLRVRKVKE